MDAIHTICIRSREWLSTPLATQSRQLEERYEVCTYHPFAVQYMLNSRTLPGTAAGNIMDIRSDAAEPALRRLEPGGNLRVHMVQKSKTLPKSLIPFARARYILIPVSSA